MSKAQTNLDELIKEGDQYNFENNKYYSYDNYYSRATPEFLSWVSKVEDYIRTNYDENSGPHKMLDSVEKQKFSGYYQSEFNTELTKLKGAIISCKNVRPNRKAQDSLILSLIKNPYFWTTLVVGIGAAYKLGFDKGVAKFDNDKTDMNNQIIIYKDSIIHLNHKTDKLEAVKKKDSANKNTTANMGLSKMQAEE